MCNHLEARSSHLLLRCSTISTREISLNTKGKVMHFGCKDTELCWGNLVEHKKKLDVRKQDSRVRCLVQAGFAGFSKGVQLISGSPYAKTENYPN